MSTQVIAPPERLEASAPAVVEAHDPRSFWTKYVFSQDHKVIGIQYLVTACLMAVVGACLAVLIRLQVGWPDEPVSARRQRSPSEDPFMRNCFPPAPPRSRLLRWQ